MIIDFTIRNFCSIQEEQTFSMFAEKDTDFHKGNITFIDDKIGVLKTAGIWGANASGKSNILKAFKALRYLITSSDTLKDNETIPCYEPFLLCSSCHKEPIYFQIEFQVSKKRFKYTIEFNEFEVLHESLDFFPTAKPANLYERTSSTNWENDEGIKFRKYYKGGSKRFPFFSNNTYISKAGNSAASPEIIQEVYQYFLKGFSFISPKKNISSDWKGDEKILSAMKSFIKNSDLGIDSFHFEKRELDEETVRFMDEIPEEQRKKIFNDLSTETVFHHKSKNGELVKFNSRIESLGTKRLLETIPLILSAFRSGSVVLCDEIESSFHPHVVELLVKLFQDPKINLNSAQLIFTTHSLSTLKCKFMRKDQMWLVEKADGATEFTSLDQFDSKLRNHSPIDKWYDEGRLGGIPTIDYSEVSAAVSKLLEGNDA